MLDVEVGSLSLKGKFSMKLKVDVGGKCIRKLRIVLEVLS